MTGAISLYERLGYRRAPEFDFDLAARYSRFGAKPIMSFAYLRHLTPEARPRRASRVRFWRRPRAGKTPGRRPASTAPRANFASQSWRIR